MPKLKRLSGGDVMHIFSLLGFAIASQHGSHVKLRRLLPGGFRQTLTIPLHSELDPGTLNLDFSPREDAFGGGLPEGRGFIDTCISNVL